MIFYKSAWGAQRIALLSLLILFLSSVFATCSDDDEEDEEDDDGPPCEGAVDCGPIEE